MPRTYDPEFRRVVELVRAGRPVRVVAAELGLAEAMVYGWKVQDLIDRGIKPGTSTSERGELAAAQTAHQGVGDRTGLGEAGRDAVEEGVRPKDTYPVIAELASQGFSTKRCCRILGVAALRVLHVAAPFALATQTPVRLADGAGAGDPRQLRGTYRWRRVNAVLVYGHGVVVNRKTVRMIMRTQGLHGLPGARKSFRSKANMATTADLVERRFDRPAPDQLWVTDITEHPTRKGKVY